MVVRDVAKSVQVEMLLTKLSTNLSKHNLSLNQCDDLLEQLKILTRSIDPTKPWFDSSGIETLLTYASDGNALSTSRGALRCLANIMLLQPNTRQMVVDSGLVNKLAERYKTDNRDDEFLLGRILFLLTYDTNVDLQKLVLEQQVADSINQHVLRHSKKYPKNGLRRSSSQTTSMPAAPNMEEMSLIETLKLIFNITHFHPDLADRFSKSIPELLKILQRHKIPAKPLEAPINYLINALINLHLDDQKKSQFSSNPLFPTFKPEVNIEHLVRILDLAIKAYSEEQLDQQAAPLLALLRRVYELAPREMKEYMEWLLLPSDDERSKPLGQSDTLASRLLRLSTSPMVPNLRESIAAMMYELSGKDADKYVKNVGFGFASGFLLAKGIPVPASAKEAWSTAGSGGPEINPVTGQRRDAEPEDIRPPMTDEEKEREAERLFVLFERLKKTGIIDVKNPIEQAIDEGRFKELPD